MSNCSTEGSIWDENGNSLYIQNDLISGEKYIVINEENYSLKELIEIIQKQ